MKRIGGLFYLDGAPADPTDIQAMSLALARHCPGGEALWQAGPVGLFQRATPRDQGLRVAEASGLSVVADARLDNRAELSRVLELPQDTPDSGLIAAAYLRWGDECARRLLGDFAFAVWDSRHRRFFCARDAFGVRPFYFHLAPGRLFAFASEIKALLALAAVPRRLNEKRVADFLATLLGNRRETFYEDIERLPAAHCLFADAAGVRTWQYWSLDAVPDWSEASDAEYEERFRHAFLLAVERRLPRGEPAGTFLSGGLDSSSIACAARHLLRGTDTPLHTFSAVFPTLPACDEQPYIQAVTAAGGLIPHAVRLDHASPLEEIEDVLAAEDQPFYGPNLFIHRALYRAAAAEGVRVLLDGLDGDTTVSHGYAYVTELFLGGRWQRVAQEARAACRRGIPWQQPLLTRCLRPVIPPGLLKQRAARKAAVTWRVDLLQPAFIRRTGLQCRLDQAAAEAARSPRTARQAHRAELSIGNHQCVLEITDHAAAACGLEPRYPFYDRELAELCVSLPGDQKLRDGWTRWIMRAALEGILPEKVCWRPGKANLSGSFRRGLLLLEAERLDRLFAEGRDRLSRYVDMREMNAIMERLRAESNGAEPLIVWKLATLCLWLRHSRVCS